ncbi:MAG: VTT domain-containing protein [Propionibacteriaceae bacterium]|nr:VTT domain-containing protein [Propionibacteriaceae bacterium]
MDPTQWNAPFAIVAAALFVIVFARANATYWIGRGIIAGTLHTRFASFLSRRGYVRAERLVNTWGAPAVTVSFLTIGLQTLVNLAAGVTRMPLRRYLPAVVLGGIAWALIYATVGFVGVQAFAALWSRSPALSIGIGVMVLAGFAWFIAVRVQARRRRARISVSAEEG